MYFYYFFIIFNIYIHKFTKPIKLAPIKIVKS